MISVDEALRRIKSAFKPLPAETVGLSEALGRVLAQDVGARLTQPPVAVSAMDGYAVRAADLVSLPVTLKQVGAAPAGGAFDGEVAPGETVRIFTGGPVPRGADTIVIQEKVEVEGDRVTVSEAVAPGSYIRPAGLDFSSGEVRIKAGHVLSARDIGLAAAMNVPWLSVRRRPRVAILATGDEIVMPGEPLGRNQIVGSNSLALAAAVRAFGGEPINLGIALDDPESLKTLTAGARGADLLVTTGGVSVGEHDLVRHVLQETGFELDFWKIAMRPGKPLTFGRIGETPVLGLPGNPVSAVVCALVFVRPAFDVMLDRADRRSEAFKARLGRDLGPNDERQEYLRARLSVEPDGSMVAMPFEMQDSAMLSRLAEADCLVIRPPFAPPAASGEMVEIIPFTPELLGI